MPLNRRAAGPALAALALSPLVLLAGCATPAPARVGAAGPTSGRLALRVEAAGDKPAHSLSADFELRGSGERGELRLSSPLGSLIAITRWAPGEALLDTGQGPVRYADLESLSRQALGEVLPLRALPDWLAGRPWPGAASTAQPTGFEQLGWTVATAGLAKGRIDAERAAAPKAFVRVRLERAP